MKGVAAKRRLLGAGALTLSFLVGGSQNALLGVCGPFSDVAADAFCSLALEIFTLGITTGTTATTYDPAGNVTRLQMAAFLSRTVDGVLNRGSRRAAMRRFWTPQNAANLSVTTVGIIPGYVDSDGADLWVTLLSGGGVNRVRASDGKLLETWSGASGAYNVIAAMGKVFVTGQLLPGRLYRIDPSQPAGTVTALASVLGSQPVGIAYDGGRIWTANLGDGSPGTGSVSIVTPGASIPWTVTNVSLGFSELRGALFDGANVWVTDENVNQLLKLSAAGVILQTVTVESRPYYPVFDGANIWVPNHDSNSISVVRASTGAVLRNLTGNGLDGPWEAAFDGQRVLVTNAGDGADSVSLWKASDLTAIGSLSTGVGTLPFGVCSDGLNFWIVLDSASKLARF